MAPIAGEEAGQGMLTIRERRDGDGRQLVIDVLFFLFEGRIAQAREAVAVEPLGGPDEIRADDEIPRESAEFVSESAGADRSGPLPTVATSRR